MEEDACDCAGDTSKSQGRGQCEDPCRGAGKDDVPNTKMDFEKESNFSTVPMMKGNKSHIKQTNKLDT